MLNPNGFVESALGMLAYRQTYYAVLNAKDESQKPIGWMADLVEAHMFEIEQESYEGRLG